MTSHFMNRRTALGGLGALALSPLMITANAASLPPATSYRNPGCGCCEKWTEHMKAADFDITMQDDSDLAVRKVSLVVPANLSGCHKALIGNYVFEGHVPSADIVSFLAEVPEAIGLSVPGMPLGSPGIEVGDQKDAYNVFLMLKDGSSSVYRSHS